MDLSCELQIKTAIKAMTDVVLPAVDPGNTLAQEQAGLVIAMLNIVAKRLPLVFQYERDQLVRFLKLATGLQAQTSNLAAGNETFEALSESIGSGAVVLDRAGADPDELKAANFDLREKIGALIMVVYARTQTRELKRVSETILAHAQEQSLRERSWLVAQGWEADPNSLPSIESLLGQ